MTWRGSILLLGLPRDPSSRPRLGFPGLGAVDERSGACAADDVSSRWCSCRRDGYTSKTAAAVTILIRSIAAAGAADELIHGHAVYHPFESTIDSAGRNTSRGSDPPHVFAQLPKLDPLGYELSQKRIFNPTCTNRWSLAAVHAWGGSLTTTPLGEVDAMVFTPTTFDRFRTFVDSAMRSTFHDSRMRNLRVYRRFTSAVRGPRNVFLPMNRGRCRLSR